MLYDKQWDKKPEVFSLKGLIAWLETQDPSTRYNFLDVRDCLITRYLESNGYEYTDYSLCLTGAIRIRIALGQGTYGKALARAKEEYQNVEQS